MDTHSVLAVVPCHTRIICLVAWNRWNRYDSIGVQITHHVRGCSDYCRSKFSSYVNLSGYGQAWGMLSLSFGFMSLTVAFVAFLYLLLKCCKIYTYIYLYIYNALNMLTIILVAVISRRLPRSQHFSKRPIKLSQVGINHTALIFQS